MTIPAGRLLPGDVIHDAANRELRGMVVHVRLATWTTAPVAWVQTSEDIATRRIDREETLLVTRGADE